MAAGVPGVARRVRSCTCQYVRCMRGAEVVVREAGRDSRKRSSSPVRRVERRGVAEDGKARREGGDVRTVATWPRIEERPGLVSKKWEMGVMGELTS